MAAVQAALALQQAAALQQATAAAPACSPAQSGRRLTSKSKPFWEIKEEQKRLRSQEPTPAGSCSASGTSTSR